MLRLVNLVTMSKFKKCHNMKPLKHNFYCVQMLGWSCAHTNIYITGLFGWHFTSDNMVHHCHKYSNTVVLFLKLNPCIISKDYTWKRSLCNQQRLPKKKHYALQRELSAQQQKHLQYWFSFSKFFCFSPVWVHVCKHQLPERKKFRP